MSRMYAANKGAMFDLVESIRDCGLILASLTPPCTALAFVLSRDQSLPGLRSIRLPALSGY